MFYFINLLMYQKNVIHMTNIRYEKLLTFIAIKVKEMPYNKTLIRYLIRAYMTLNYLLFKTLFYVLERVKLNIFF